MNKVILLGHLGQNPELRFTTSQVPVANFTLATSESTTKDGQRVETTEWHRIIVWQKLAENCAQYLKKGSKALIEGRIQSREFIDKNGQKRFLTEIVATNVQFLSSPQEKQNAETTYSGLEDISF